MTIETQAVGALQILPLKHPQGCRGYLAFDPESKEALLLDPHLDHAAEATMLLESHELTLRWIVDSHTHADHPSAAAALAGRDHAVRVAHAKSRHVGVTHMPDDTEPLALGDQQVVVRHAPGHTPDHMVLVSDAAVFTGDSLFIGGVARADFIGGDAGQLYDSLHDVVLALPDETVVYPGHDYKDRIRSTIGAERQDNAWLQITDRDKFVESLTASKPPEPANMAALLRFNVDGQPVPHFTNALETIEIVEKGGAGTIIDVRTLEELQAAHIAGSRHIVMDDIMERADDVRITPAPRLILCRTDRRAQMVYNALHQMGIGGLSVIKGGIVAYAEAGGATEGGDPGAALEGGGCCAAELPPQ